MPLMSDDQQALALRVSHPIALGGDRVGCSEKTGRVSAIDGVAAAPLPVAEGMPFESNLERIA